MRFQVPQFVDIQDKIIGPLTLRQFLYYAVAGLIVAPIYMLADLSLFITIAVPIGGLTVLFAHARFYGQSFARVLMSAVMQYTSEHLFLWRRAPGAKPLSVGGSELERVGGIEALPMTSLKSTEQMLNTQGSVIEEDMADPMLKLGEESERSERGKAAAAKGGEGGGKNEG